MSLVRTDMKDPEHAGMTLPLQTKSFINDTVSTLIVIEKPHRLNSLVLSPMCLNSVR